MTMENQSFEDVFPINKRGFSIVMFVFGGVYDYLLAHVSRSQANTANTPAHEVCRLSKVGKGFVAA